MNSLFVLALAAAMLLRALPLQAHHSFGGTYDVDKEITIKGKMVQVSRCARRIRSFTSRSRTPKATAQRWADRRRDRPRSLRSKGIDKDAFKIGDPVEVVANPSRSPNSTRARLIKITRTTDGKSWGTQGETV